MTEATRLTLEGAEHLLGEEGEQTRLEKLIEELPSHIGEDAFTVFYQNDESYYEDLDLDDLVEKFEEAYQGHFEDDADFVSDLLDSTGDLDGLSNLIRYNIDWRGIYYDLRVGDGYWDDGGYYFRSV